MSIDQLVMLAICLLYYNAFMMHLRKTKNCAFCIAHEIFLGTFSEKGLLSASRFLYIFF